MESSSLPKDDVAINCDLTERRHTPKRCANEEPLPDSVASAAETPNNGYQHLNSTGSVRSPLRVSGAEATANNHETPSDRQGDEQTALFLVQNLENRLNTLHDDMRHLEKRCKFYEKKCKLYQKRQKKLEMRFSKKEKNSTGHNEEDDGKDENVDEEAMEDFYAGGDVCDDSDWSNDSDVDNEVEEERDDENKEKKRKKRKSSNETKTKIYSDAVIFPPKTLDFYPMFEKLRVYHQLHGNCNVTSAYGDKQLQAWLNNWKERRRRFDKMVEKEGGQQVVFPGLDDVDAKTYTKDAIPQYSHEWEDQQVQHLESKRDQLYRRFMLRTRHQIKCLNALDFNWKITPLPRFEDRLVELQDFIREHGHYNIPREYGGIGDWFHKVKQNFVFRKKNFMEKQYPLLLEMGVDMNVAVQGRRRRRRKKKHDVNCNNDVGTEDFDEVNTGDVSGGANC